MVTLHLVFTMPGMYRLLSSGRGCGLSCEAGEASEEATRANPLAAATVAVAPAHPIRGTRRRATGAPAFALANSLLLPSLLFLILRS